LAGKRHVSPGAFLRAGTPITSLAQIDRLRASFAIPERILSALAVGAEVAVTTPAFPGKVLNGTIDVIEPQLDPLTRNVGVIALVDNPERLLRPGMSATIEVVLGRRQNALTVPSDAVFVEGGQAWVYVIKPDSVVTRTPVTLGTRLAGAVEVTEGLAADQSVVKAGHQKLYEGAKVNPVGPAAPAGGDGEGEAR
jgi:membrane fusion protein (multidrug efflux system)